MILLASQSPQRAVLLARAQIAFRVVASAADEELVREADPSLLALHRARLKARQALAGSGVVLGADTVVALDGRDYGKPRDHADARRMLRELSGTTHRVITGHWLTVLEDGVVRREAGVVDECRITMRPLSAATIHAYVASGESMGRAGAFALQEHGDALIERRDGAWDTVVGLHVASVEALYRALCGVPLPRP